MLLAGCRSLRVVCWLLCVASCLLCRSCSLWFVVAWLCAAVFFKNKCSLLAVCVLLVVWCLLCNGCWSLYVLRCLLFVVSVFVVRWLLLLVNCCFGAWRLLVLIVVCRLLSAVCCM